MRATLASTLLVATSLANAQVPYFSLEKRDKHTNGLTRDVAKGLVRRQRSGASGDGYVETNLFNVETWSTGGAYYANITVGTPPQPQVVIVDTGSSDLYFDASSAQTCALPATDPYSCRGGTLNTGDSSSYHQVEASPAFNTSFGDGSTAYGPFATDTVCLGDVCIENVQFGVANTVNSTTGYAIGLMGLGYSYIEASQTHQYANIPEVLVNSGVINSRLYSVYLNDVDSTGSILFGAVDTSLYTGELVTLDFLPDYQIAEAYQEGIVIQFVQVVTAVSATVGGRTTQFFSNGASDVTAYTSSQSLPVLLDTGSAAWSVPQDFYDKYIGPAFSYVDAQGACPCSHASSGDSVTLTFGGAVTIKVSAREFIVPIYNGTTREPIPYPNTDDTACAFMIQPNAVSDGFWTLGDSILRAMYLVYDLDNGQISIAQAKLNSTGQAAVTTVPAGAGGLASAVSASNVAGPSNSYSVAAAASATAQFTASTAASTLGEATGTAAIPTIAQVEESSGSGHSTGGSGAASSSGVAAGVVVPGFDWSAVWVAGVAVIGIGTGMGLMM